MSIKLITAWVPGDADSSKAAEKLIATMTRIGVKGGRVEKREGFAVTEVEVASRPAMTRLRDELRADFGLDFGMQNRSADEAVLTERLVAQADAAAGKVGCVRVGNAQPLADALGEARGARIHYSAPAIALRKILREAGLEPDQEQVRIRVDVWLPAEPLPGPLSPPTVGVEVTDKGGESVS